MKIFTVVTRSTKKSKVERIVLGNRIIIKGTQAQIEAELASLRAETAESAEKK